MTSPRELRLELMLWVSRSRFPTDPDFSRRSDPARSTRVREAAGKWGDNEEKGKKRGKKWEFEGTMGKKKGV